MAVWVGEEDCDESVGPPGFFQCTGPEAESNDARKCPEGLQHGD